MLILIILLIQFALSQNLTDIDWSDPKNIDMFYDLLFTEPWRLNRTNISVGVRLTELTYIEENEAWFECQFEIDITYPSWMRHSNYSADIAPKYADVIPFVIGERATALADAHAMELFSYEVDGFWAAKYMATIRYSYAFDFKDFFLDTHKLPARLVCMVDMYRYQCNFAHHNLGYQPPPRGWEIDKLEEFVDGWILALPGLSFPYNQYYFPIGGISINITRVSTPMMLRLAFPLWVIMIILFTTRAFRDPAERLGHVITILLVLVAYNLSTLTLIPKGNTTTRVDTHTMISYVSVFLVFAFNFTIVLVQLKLDQYQAKQKAEVLTRRQSVSRRETERLDENAGGKTNAEKQEVEMLGIARDSAHLNDIWDKGGKRNSLSTGRDPSSSTAGSNFLKLPKVNMGDMNLTKEEQEKLEEKPWWIKMVFEYEDEVYIILFLGSFIGQILVYVL